MPTVGQGCYVDELFVGGYTKPLARAVSESLQRELHF